MFIYALIISIILGYLFGGKLKNLKDVEIKAVYLIVIGFIIEFSIVILIKKGYLEKGILTFALDFFMYILIFIFAYKNKKNKWILIMTLGFLLNAAAIFINGGAMPVSKGAMKAAGLSTKVNKEGLYILINSKTILPIICDIIPIKIIRSYVVSIGDLIAAVSMIIFIITGMKNKTSHKIIA